MYYCNISNLSVGATEFFCLLHKLSFFPPELSCSCFVFELLDWKIFQILKYPLGNPYYISMSHKISFQSTELFN